jgi:hypothetical protein
MSESQSRYSIVERLTRTKLDIMSAKQELKEELKLKKQKIEDLEQDLQNWSQDIEEDIKRQKRIKERQIENAKRDSQNSDDRLEEKMKVYDNKIQAIDKALKSIEEISKTTPTVNK